MPTKARKPGPGPCNPACTRTIKFLDGVTVPANVGINVGPYLRIDAYRHINFFVRFTQFAATEPPVDLGVMFAFDAAGNMGTRCYVNFEENVPTPQSTSMITVSGAGCWHGSPFNISTYLARFPVMGPFAEVFAYNQAPVDRVVDVWAYLVS